MCFVVRFVLCRSAGESGKPVCSHFVLLRLDSALSVLLAFGLFFWVFVVD